MIIPPCDLDRIMSVMDAAFDPIYGEAWTRKQVSDALVIGQCHYAIAGGADPEGASLALPPESPAAGFRLSRCIHDEEELLLLAVVPSCRRRGIGRALLQSLLFDSKERGAKRLILEMRRGNPAESLYRSFGFEQIGRRPNYYRSSTGERIDALTFAYEIEDVCGE